MRRTKLEAYGAWIAAAAFAVFASMAANVAVAGIANTKHNLGTQGTKDVHLTAGTDQICVFCHTPHGAAVTDANNNPLPPIWNRTLPSTTYQVYGTGGTSASLDGEVLSVGSVSAACLSCHDGTTAIDTFINAPGSGTAKTGTYTWTGTPDGKMPASGITNIGDDLRNDHPIGVPYCGGFTTGTTCRDPDFNAVASGTINGTVQYWVDSAGLDGTGGTASVREKTDMILYRRTFAEGMRPSVECASCHDPHVEETATRKTFLRIANTGSALCLTCHNK